MPICEYCGDEFTKGGAYATHVRYCESRPEGAVSTGEDGDDSAGGPEGGGDGSEDAITVEISEDPTADGPTAVTAGDETNSEPADRQRAASQLGEDDSTLGSGRNFGSGWDSRRVIAVVLVILALVVVWQLLSGRENES